METIEETQKCCQLCEGLQGQALVDNISAEDDLITLEVVQ